MINLSLSRIPEEENFQAFEKNKTEVAFFMQPPFFI